MQTIRVITLCSGYDAQCLALRRAAVPFDLLAWSDIDDSAITAHNALWPEYSDRNLGDMTKIDWDNKCYADVDLLTYSTPCTDISIAGEKKGFAEGSGTQSSVLWHTRDAIKHLKPKYLLQENVKAIVTGNNARLFDKWQKEVEDLGYTNYWQVLDAADFGVPQRRTRLFMVSVRNDVGKKFTFPYGKPLQVRLYDYLDGVYPNKIKQMEPTTICLNHKDYEHGYGENIRSAGFRAFDVRGISPCLVSSFISLIAIPYEASVEKTYYHDVDGVDRVNLDRNEWCVRYPTPRELLRLMGLQTHEQDAIVHSGLCGRKIQYVAGNSIVVQVLTEIFRSMFPKIGYQLSLFDF